MRVPLRLAITDQLDEGDSSSSAEAEQPWSVRLAGRLLRLAAQGGACPWAPYLAVLPQAVPSPLTAFSWEDVQAVEVRRGAPTLPCAVCLPRACLPALPAAIALCTPRC